MIAISSPLSQIRTGHISSIRRQKAGAASILTRLISSIALLTALNTSQIQARDDGRYANSQLKSWFDSLKSGKGPCCSFADGRTVEDVDVETSGDHYRVRIDGEWIDVPPEALITEPNRAKMPIVWPYKDQDGKTQIRCFIAGPLV